MPGICEKVGFTLLPLRYQSKWLRAGPREPAGDTGSALVKDGARQDAVIHVIDDSWLSEKTLFTQPIVAVQPGIADLAILATYSTGYKNRIPMTVTVESVTHSGPAQRELH